MKSQSLEERLGQYYNLDSAIPKSIADTVRNASTNAKQSMQPDTVSFFNNQESGVRLLNDDTISHGRREQIALSLLTGTYNRLSSGVSDFSLSQMSAFDAEESAEVVRGPSRGHSLRPKFLEVSSNAAVISSPRKIAEREEEIQRLRGSKNRTKEVYSWAGTAIQISDSGDPPERSKRSVASDGLAKKNSSFFLKTKQWKMEQLLKNKKECIKQEVERDERRKLEDDNIKLKMKHAKNLKVFRQKLKERFEEKNDPLHGSVMRCINDKTAHLFMEKYEGYTMSVDAVLAMIGSQLGANDNTVNIDYDDSTILDDSTIISTDTHCLVSSSQKVLPRKTPGSKRPVLSAELLRREHAQQKGHQNLLARTISREKKSRGKVEEKIQKTRSIDFPEGDFTSPQRTTRSNIPSSPTMSMTDSIRTQLTRKKENQGSPNYEIANRTLSSEQLNDLGTGQTKFDNVESEFRRINIVKNLRNYQYDDSLPPSPSEKRSKKNSSSLEYALTLLGKEKLSVKNGVIPIESDKVKAEAKVKRYKYRQLSKSDELALVVEQFEFIDNDTISTLSHHRDSFRLNLEPTSFTEPPKPESLKRSKKNKIEKNNVVNLEMLSNYNKVKKGITNDLNKEMNKDINLEIKNKPFMAGPGRGHLEGLKFAKFIATNSGLGLGGFPQRNDRLLLSGGRSGATSNVSTSRPQSPKPFFG